MKKAIIVLALAVLPHSYAQAEKKFFSSSSELAIVSAGGNSNLQTYNTKTDNRWSFSKRSITFSGHYTLGLADSGEPGENDLIESARNWDARTSYSQKLRPHFSAFAALQYEGDKFSGYIQRENHDIGGKYVFTETDRELFYFELGYRYTEEMRLEPDDKGRNRLYFNKSVLTSEIQRKRETYTYGLWLQYVPNFTTPEDYQILAEPSLTMILNDSFSLKISYRGTYDNEPNGENNKRLDWRYTTGLVAKY